jgi:glycosyltransferase involved in cell wall biosynthesis
MKVDLVMWTKNGERTLPCVLDRINQVIPNDMINRRFIVDDHSIDHTREIADLFGWKVIFNEGKGISDGANTALKNVESEFFCSFEQDLILAKDWWRKISGLLSDKVAVASGMRFVSQPKYLATLQKYVAKKYRGERYLSSWLRSREASSFTLGKTLDNTIYVTEIMRKIGGFPRLNTTAGVDTVLAYSLENAGYKWHVDYSTQSIHLRSGLREEIEHQYSYGCQLQEIWRSLKFIDVDVPINRFSIVSRLLYSPLTGLIVALKTRQPEILVVHPLIRFYYVKGLLKRS